MVFFHVTTFNFHVEGISNFFPECITPDNYQEGYLAAVEVNDWIYQKGRFAELNQTKPSKRQGGFRLLICERLGWRPLEFSMSRDSFLALEKEFELPVETLPTLNMNGGHHFCRFKYSDPDKTTIESMGKNNETLSSFCCNT
jgi:hypothetical protein